jgi:hypothetical protein
MNDTRPYTVKGINFTTPKGKALWCKIHEPDRKFNKAGDLTVSLVCDPKDADVKDFIKLLEAVRDEAYKQTCESLGEVKAKAVKVRPVFSEETNKKGKPTGDILFKLKLKDIDERKATAKQYQIAVVDANKSTLTNVPKIGNGSIIRCAGFANPYFMASTKEIGISLIWQKMQLIELVAADGGDAFGVESGYEGSASPYGTETLAPLEMPF